MRTNSSLDALKVLGLITQAGLSMAVSLIVFMYASRLLASYLGNEILLLLLGVFLGLGAGFYAAYRLLIRFVKTKP